MARGFDQSGPSYRPLQDWVVAGDITDLAIQWYLPGDREVEAAQGIVTTFLGGTPDNTKALTALTTTYQKVPFFAGVQRDEYDSRWKGFQALRGGWRTSCWAARSTSGGSSWTGLTSSTSPG